MKISEIIIDKYKLRIPPTVYYELLADVQEVEEEQEAVIDKIRAEIIELRSRQNVGVLECLDIIDKYKAETR